MLSGQRELIQQAEFKCIADDPSKGRYYPLHFYLFNDMLLLTSIEKYVTECKFMLCLCVDACACTHCVSVDVWSGESTVKINITYHKSHECRKEVVEPGGFTWGYALRGFFGEAPQTETKQEVTVLQKIVAYAHLPTIDMRDVADTKGMDIIRLL